jgi:hypothetical protein
MEAWRRKEHILDNQRKSVQRTVVLDDQADFHATTASAWSTREEKADEDVARKKAEEDRRRQVLSINI